MRNRVVGVWPGLGGNAVGKRRDCKKLVSRLVGLRCGRLGDRANIAKTQVLAFAKVPNAL